MDTRISHRGLKHQHHPPGSLNSCISVTSLFDTDYIMAEHPQSSPLKDRSNVPNAARASPHKRKLVDGDGVNYEGPTRQKGLNGTGLQFGTLRPIDMAVDTAVDTAAKEKCANNVSDGGVSEDADRVKEGGLTSQELTDLYTATLNKTQAQAAAYNAPAIQGPPQLPKDHVVAHGAHGVGAEAEEPPRRAKPYDSLNSLDSSSGKGGAEPSHSAEGSTVLALGKKDTHVAHGAHGSDGSDNDEVNHRGGAPRRIIESEDEGPGDETSGKTGGERTEGVESEDLQDTDSEGESASHADHCASHADHCATLDIAHNASKNDIKEAYKRALELGPGDKEGASEWRQKVEKAKRFLLAAVRNAFRKADNKEKAMAAARKAQKVDEASGVESGGKTGDKTGDVGSGDESSELSESGGIKDAVATHGVTRHSPSNSVANGCTRDKGRKAAKARKAAARKVAEADALAFDSEGWVDPGHSTSDDDLDDVDDADDAGTTGMTGDGDSDDADDADDAGTTGNGETDDSDDEAAASGGKSVDEGMGADEEDELIDVLQLEYTYEELVMFKNDSAGQFKTFHRAMINGGDGVDMDDIDSEDKRNIAKTLAKFFVAVDAPGSANEKSVISYLRLTYSKCPLVNEDAVIIGVAVIEKSTIKELAGDNAVAIWLTDIHKDTGGYDNSRVYRSVKFDPSLFPELGELDLNTFVGLRFDKELPATAGAIIKMKIDMTKVKPVLEFLRTVHASGDQDMYE